MKRLFLAAACAAALVLAGCATTPEGTPDCSQAPSQRAAITAGLAAADLAYDQAVTFCKEGEAGDKCRDVAAKAKAGAITLANIALIALNSRCPSS